MAEQSSDAASVALRRGREFFRAIPHSAVLGLELVDFQRDTAIARVPYRPEMVGNPRSGAIHGGVLTTLIDQTSGTAVFCTLPEPESVATLDLRIDYLRSPQTGVALLARAQCYRVTPNICFVRCDAYQEGDDVLVATSVSSFMRTGSKLGILVGNGYSE